MPPQCPKSSSPKVLTNVASSHLVTNLMEAHFNSKTLYLSFPNIILSRFDPRIELRFEIFERRNKKYISPVRIRVWIINRAYCEPL
mmetsp:Transcript_1798/g.3536  ORF Transcript_1798/g.3536 Transcript_1798/m.3536 type:complete len:86 (-) Transcript_1798:24-281(-)